MVTADLLIRFVAAKLRKKDLGLAGVRCPPLDISRCFAALQDTCVPYATLALHLGTA
jgi:hypothetical protein